MREAIVFMKLLINAPIIGMKTSSETKIATIFGPLIGAIPVGAMQAANYSVDRDVGKVTPLAASRSLISPAN